MPPLPQPPIRDRLADAGGGNRWLWGANSCVRVETLAGESRLDVDAADLADASVLIATRDPLATAVALVELDGIAARLVIGTPDLGADHLPRVLERGMVDAIITDSAEDSKVIAGGRPVFGCALDGPRRPRRPAPNETRTTEWVLLTSGTTGAPKLVVHTLATLSGAIAPAQQPQPDLVWGTFYDIRRYGGMQILMRALLGGGSFVVSGAGEPAADYLSRLSEHAATHISGTATHWRRAMMSPASRAIHPRYVRLSGEIADQAILNSLRAFYPDARVAHAFASTEAGLAFEVNDGFEGFPASLLDGEGPVETRIVDGSLRIRSNRSALGYLDGFRRPVADDDSFVDTGDMIERRGDRCFFLGRRTGVINVGGLKVYPEEVEAAINRHPAVRMSLVRPRRNPITGALVAADVVLNDPTPHWAEPSSAATALRHEILALCRTTLPAHKIPTSLRFVPSLDMAAAGKLVRGDA
jgi:acyl-coenzyme A synthetase/AMP-(fatty) acid ligase